MTLRQLDLCSSRSQPYTGDRHMLVHGYRLPVDYFDVVADANGFATDGALFRFFGINTNLGFGDLQDQNERPWIAEYGSLCARLVFIAEDVFGDRYAFAFKPEDDAAMSVVKFYCEGGEIEVLPFLHLSDFLNDSVLRSEPIAFDYKLARAALEAGIRPGLSEHLAFKLPLIAGGEYSLENLGIETSEMHLGVLGQLTSQMQSLPTGAKIVRFRAT